MAAGFYNHIDMKEANLMRVIMLATGKLRNVRLFRNNTGQAWQGKSKTYPVSTAPVQVWLPPGHRYIIITDPRPIDAGLYEGSSDLVGYTEVKITPEMVGQSVAIFTALEVKKDIKSIASAKQINFLTVIKNAGGIAGLARSIDEAERLLKSKG
jgi:hypothetical protein